MRILIADDDAASRALLMALLSPYGVGDTAENGREAVEAFSLALLNSSGYDLVCLDLVMPELDGFEALRAIREAEIFANVPSDQAAKVIVTSSLSPDILPLDSGPPLWDAYLVKPLSLDSVKTAVEELGLA